MEELVSRLRGAMERMRTPIKQMVLIGPSNISQAKCSHSFDVALLPPQAESGMSVIKAVSYLYGVLNIA
jgi:hypothetical protein